MRPDGGASREAVTHSIATAVFAVYVGCYALLFIISPNLGMTDDFTFLRTLQAAKPMLYYASDFPYYDVYAIGRFNPLASLVYNLPLLFRAAPTPVWYYAIHAFQFVVLAFLLVRILQQYEPSRRRIYLYIVLLTLLTGFTYSWFRMQLTEREVVFFSAGFLYCYMRYRTSFKPMWLVLAFIAATYAIFCKETGFILFGAYAFTYLAFSWLEKDCNVTLMRFHLALLGSALGYLVLYCALVLPYADVFAYGKGELPPYEVLTKNVLNYLFVSDPIIILLLLPLAVSRLYSLFVHHKPAEPFYDSLLLGASLFVAAYFVLNLSGVYYFQPAYIMAIPPLFHFLRERIARKPWRQLAITAGALMVLNTIPTGVHYLTYYKYAPSNFNAAMDFLVAEISRQSTDRRVNIFLEGVNRGTGKFTYFIVSEFLLSKGLTADKFDLKSNVESDVHQEGYFPFLEKIPTPFTVFQEKSLQAVARGDYLVVSAQSTDPQKTLDNAGYLATMESEYELVFKTDSPLAIPLINLKSLGRYLISIGAKPGDRLLRVSRHRPALELPDYYIFVRK